ncbi:MAG: hypothetical protein QF464_05830, partial [Myxococcota bacterium]|nr:hypothetical protein [Myxococcota bacterium]
MLVVLGALSMSADARPLRHGKGEFCETSRDCAKGLECFVECPDGATGCDTVASDTCVDPDDLYCTYNESCALSGHCSLDRDSCTIGGPGDCRQSERCRHNGACSFGLDSAGGGQCVATSDSDCAPSEHCRLRGECTARNGQCVVGSERECRASQECREEGLCFLEKRREICVSREDLAKYRSGDAFCRKTRVCKEHAWCSVMELDAPPQELTEEEEEHAHIEWLEAQGGEGPEDADREVVFHGGCGLATDEDCGKTFMCAVRGLCAAGGPEGCVALDAARCKKSTACRQVGACDIDVVEERCVPTATSHCKRSAACRLEGL